MGKNKFTLDESSSLVRLSCVAVILADLSAVTRNLLIFIFSPPGFSRQAYVMPLLLSFLFFLLLLLF